MDEIDRLLAGIEQALRVPAPIGTLDGHVVYLNMWERTLAVGELTCSLDHPYLVDTEIRAAALRYMGEQK